MNKLEPSSKYSNIKHLLLDIEGTVSDVRFVYNVMFPYAKRNMAIFLESHWGHPETLSALEQVAADAGWELSNWLELLPESAESDQTRVNKHLQDLMSKDSKSTGLKALQGLVWKSGFESGEMRAELFPDVLPAIERWKTIGLNVSIYSSGSVLAQKLFFGYTTQGDILSKLSSFFDTTTGKKQDPTSYASIASALGLPASEILFLSDVAEELKAADDSGMHAIAILREGNKPLSEIFQGDRVSSFDDLPV